MLNPDQCSISQMQCELELTNGERNFRDVSSSRLHAEKGQPSMSRSESGKLLPPLQPMVRGALKNLSTHGFEATPQPMLQSESCLQPAGRSPPHLPARLPTLAPRAHLPLCSS